MPSPPDASADPAVRTALPWRLVGGIAALSVVYALLAFAGLRWAAAYELGAPVLPAAGVALVALVLLGRRLWPGILVGYLLAAWADPVPHALSTVAATGLANAFAAYAAAWLLERAGFSPALETVRDFLHFLLAATASALLAASLGGAVDGLVAGLDSTAMANAWLHRVLADLNGLLLIGTLLFAWSTGRVARSPRWWLQLGACLLLAIGVGVQVFLREGERLYTFLAYVPLIWAVLALHLRGATLVCLVLSALGTWGTTAGIGPFMDVDLHIRLLDLQSFVLVMAGSMLVLTAVADERRAQRALGLSEARLRLALEATDTGLWKLDLHGGAMSFSPECARVAGVAPGDVGGSRDGVARLIHPEDLPAVREALRAAIDGDALFEAAFRLQRRDGSEAWLEARGRAVAEGDGRPGTMLGTITDVTARRRDERRLAEQARLLDLTADAIFIRDLDGRIEYWNRGAEALYGHPAHEACGRIASELLGTGFPQRYSEVEAELLATDRWEGELSHVRRDGSRVAVHARWVLNRDARGRPVSVMQTQTDVTARKRAEGIAALLAELDRHLARASHVDDIAESGLRLLGRHFDLLHCALSDVDVDGAQVRTLHEWTAEAAAAEGPFDLRGVLTAEMGRRLAAGEVVAVDDLRTDPLTAAFASSYATRGVLSLAAASYVIEGRPAGTLVVAAGQPRAWGSDETRLLREVVARLWPAIERARSVAALRESEARFRQMADTAPIMIWLTEPDGSCSYVSRRWCEFTGRLPEAELGMGWLDVVHVDDRQASQAVLVDALARQDGFSIEYRALRWDGAWRWLHATARPRFGAGSEFLGYIGAIMDVTERRDAEDALREADRRKDQFLATLAHELRNPLSPIRTGLQVLNLTDDPDTARRTRQMMERQLGHMVRLIDDLLDVSRITSGKVVLQRERIALQDAVRTAVESARPAITAARHRLAVDMPEAPLWVDADPTRLAQVLGNLLGNAAKYTPDGGDIRLAVEAAPDEARITVTDTGLGIPRDSLDAVFGMFAQVNRTLDRAQGGLGIGLALAQRLIGMHGGRITADSAGLGHGATFTVHLPLAAGESAQATPELPAATGAPSARVLVVDDNADAAESLAMMLRLDGHEVRVAFSGAEGLQLAAGFVPDFAFVDIGMPGMNGYELAQRLRAEPALERLHLVAVSGWGGEADRRRALEAGFDLHLTKPVEAASVLAVLQRAASRSAERGCLMRISSRPG